MTERPPNTIKAELDAVRKRLSELESIQRSFSDGKIGSPKSPGAGQHTCRRSCHRGSYLNALRSGLGDG